MFQRFSLPFAHLSLPVFLILSGTIHAQSGDSTRAAWLAVARELIRESGACALITTDKNKQPRVRTMDPFEPDEHFIIRLGTNPKSRKVSEINKNKRVTLYYANGDNGYVSVYGTAEFIQDAAVKSTWWKPEWEAYYPDRDQSYLLIQVIPSRIEIISYRHGLNGDPVTWQPHVVTFTKR